MNPVLKGQIIQAIRDPRNKVIESDLRGNTASNFFRDTKLMNKNFEQLMHLQERGYIDTVRYLLTIGDQTVFDVTAEDGDTMLIQDEWEIILELRRSVDRQRCKDNKTPLTPKEKSMIDFLKQKQR